MTWTATAIYAPLGYDVPGAVRVPGSGRLLAITQPNGASGAILGSDDDGTTWAPVGTAPGVSPFSSRLVAAPDGAVYLYENHGDADDRHGRPVWRSTDGGTSWEDVGPVWTEWSAVPQRVVVGPDGRLWAAAEGRPGWDGVPLGGVFRTVDPVYAVAGESESERAEAGVGLRVSPNPTRGAATVTAVLASPTRVRVSVVDAVGREVAVVHDGPAADGQRFAVETAGLPAGAYRVRVRIAGGAVASAGLIVAR